MQKKIRDDEDFIESHVPQNITAFDDMPEKVYASFDDAIRSMGTQMSLVDSVYRYGRKMYKKGPRQVVIGGIHTRCDKEAIDNFEKYKNKWEDLGMHVNIPIVLTDTIPVMRHNMDDLDNVIVLGTLGIQAHSIKNAISNEPFDLTPKFILDNGLYLPVNDSRTYMANFY